MGGEIPPINMEEYINKLREDHKLLFFVDYFDGKFSWKLRLMDADLTDNNSVRLYTSGARINTFEEARKLGLEIAAKIVAFRSIHGRDKAIPLSLLKND